MDREQRSEIARVKRVRLKQREMDGKKSRQRFHYRRPK